MKPQGWFAHPWLSALLAVTWLLLQRTLEPVHLLSAALIGLILPRMLHRFLPQSTPVHVRPAVQLLGFVLWDIVMSNITVARLVLGPNRKLRPAWVPVPFVLAHPTAISLYATIITTTPGTVSCTVDEERRVILVHALDCSDALQMAADMTARYEVLLLAIFGEPPLTTGDKS